MRFVTNMGMVWRLSNKSFKKLSDDLKANNGHVDDLDDYGTLIIGRLYGLDEVVDEVEGYN